MKILLVDDEQSILMTLGDEITAAGHELTTTDKGDKARSLLRNHQYDLVISDIRLPGSNGMELLKAVKDQQPGTEVILITGFGSVESAVEAMRVGAFNYIRKPFLNEEMLAQIRKIEEFKTVREKADNLQRENIRLRESLSERPSAQKLIGKSRKFTQVLETLKTVAKTEATVLLVGESGTGKELMAEAIHQASGRLDQPFVKFSCAVLPDNLLEDELFGHEKGAFTGAHSKKIGRFELANHGTVFIDDIDDMPLATQVKLLRVLQNREFERIGGTKTITLDIRFVIATKIELAIAVEEGKFREDLYYRLNVVPIDLPSLRERTEDIPLLVEHFLALYGEGQKFSITTEVMKKMKHYPWPGNVRELQHAIQRAVVLAGDSTELKEQHILREGISKMIRMDKDYTVRSLTDVVQDAEIVHIRATLDACDGQRTKTAATLGISRKTLWEKMRLYGIQ